MSGRIPREFIDDLLVRVDLVDLVDSHVPLKKSGSNYIARCPFHTEKTPSFTVNRNKQLFHCFGCGASGNAIGFLMDYNHLSFVEAIEDLAAIAGLEIPREQGGFVSASDRTSEDLTDVYALLQQVAKFYADQLRANPEGGCAVDYLKTRGVSGESARDFLLGYAPDNWHTLEKHFDYKQLIAAGLLVAREDGSHYDRFRGRIMFPIRDRRGRVIGFGGRVVDESLPKYLNSPETPVFHKGKEVYGLFEVLEKNPRPERIVIVEGYMDVIALSQFGIDVAVATLGTATSKAHLDLLFRFSSELVFCFDGDAAGRKAAWRAVEEALPSLRDGRQVKVMLLASDTDPDSWVREHGIESFMQGIKSAKTLSDFLFKQLSEGLTLDNIESRAGLVEKVLPYLKKLPNGIFQDLMQDRLKQLAGVESIDVFENRTKLYVAGKNTGRERRNLSPARTAIALLLQYPELAEVVEQKQIDWSGLDLPGMSLLRKILLKIQGNPRVNTAVLVEDFRGQAEQKQVVFLAQLEIMVPDAGRAQELSGSLDRLLDQAREEKLAVLLDKEKTQGLNQQERERLLQMLRK